MTKIAQSMMELIGNTPLVELNHYSQQNGIKARLIAKVEYFNPSGSVKCRIGNAMILAGEKAGLIRPGTTIIEPTSGNTGIALAFAAAARGYRLILVMPDTMSVERRKLLKAYGAELVLTPGSEGMSGAIRRAEELAAEIPGSFIPQQFENKANPETHRRTTAEEIWRDTTEPLISSLRCRNRRHHYSVEKFLRNENLASGSLPSNRQTRGSCRRPPGPHKLQGIGAGFVPANFNRAIVDEIFPGQHRTGLSTVHALVAARAF
jgi:cysteine synthase A